MNHFITFQRNPADGQHRALCSCGWTASGAMQEVTDSAAVHDLDAACPIKPTRAKPRRGFVSGAYRGSK